MKNLQQKKHFKKLAKLQEKRKAKLMEKKVIDEEEQDVEPDNVESEVEEDQEIENVEESQKGTKE